MYVNYCKRNDKSDKCSVIVRNSNMDSIPKTVLHITVCNIINMFVLSELFIFAINKCNQCQFGDKWY